MSNPNLRLNRLNNTIRKKGESGAQIYEKNKKTVVLSSDRNIIFDTDGGQLSIQDGGYPHFLFDCDATALTIYDDTNSDDGATITVAANGVTTIATNDNDGTSGHLVLNPDGNVGIGTSSPDLSLHIHSGDSHNTMKLDCGEGWNSGIQFAENDTMSWTVFNQGADGYFRILDAGSDDGVQMAQGGAAFSDASDERIKENITTITNALSKVNSIKGVNYTYKYGSDSYKARKRVGLIAQDVLAVLPEVIDGADKTFQVVNDTELGRDRAEGWMSLQYGRVTALLVEAIKELSAKVTALESA